MDALPSRTIAVIENDALTLEFLHHLLEHWGHTPRSFRDPAQALAQATSGMLRPDLLLVDLHLDAASRGDTLIAAMRALPGLGHLPAVITTGDLDYRVQDLQGVQVLTKPVRPDRLKRTLSTLLSEPCNPF